VLLEEKEKKPVQRPRSPRPILWIPSRAKTREGRILETVWTTFRKKKAPTPVAIDLSNDGWKAENWGLDSTLRVLNIRNTEQTDHNETRAELKPPPSDLVEVEKSESSAWGSVEPKLWSSGRTCGNDDMEYTRRVEGVLTPLSSPVLQGASLSVYPAFLHAYGFSRRGSLDGTPSGRDSGS